MKMMSSSPFFGISMTCMLPPICGGSFALLRPVYARQRIAHAANQHMRNKKRESCHSPASLPSHSLGETWKRYRSVSGPRSFRPALERGRVSFSVIALSTIIGSGATFSLAVWTICGLAHHGGLWSHEQLDIRAVRHSCWGMERRFIRFYSVSSASRPCVPTVAWDIARPNRWRLLWNCIGGTDGWASMACYFGLWFGNVVRDELCATEQHSHDVSTHRSSSTERGSLLPLLGAVWQNPWVMPGHTPSAVNPMGLAAKICSERQAAAVGLIVGLSAGLDIVQTEALDAPATPFVDMSVEQEERWCLDVRTI